MGFVRKITGIQGQIDSVNANTASQEAATKEAALGQAAALNASAMAAAQQQAQLAARSAAEQKAQAAVSTPLQEADVKLADPAANGTAARRGRRASFGRDYKTGVSI
jgi:hypothetical protein